MLKHKKIIIILSLILLLTLIVPTYAWLSSSDNIIVSANSGEMTCSLVKVDNLNGSSVEASQVKYNSINLVDGKYERIAITINCNIETNIESYIRIKILDEWVRTRQYIATINKEDDVEVINRDLEGGTSIFPFDLAEGWYYDEVTKYCYYQNLLSQNTSNIPFIISCEGYTPRQSSLFTETCNLYLSFRIEMIQSNRYEEVWNITSIPRAQNGGGN